MKLPHSIKIGSAVYKVKVAKLPLEMLGKCSFSSATITINKRFAKQYYIGSFLHEVVEAICFQYGIDIKHEHLTTLSEVMAELFKDWEEKYAKQQKRTRKKS